MQKGNTPAEIIWKVIPPKLAKVTKKRGRYTTREREYFQNNHVETKQ